MAENIEVQISIKHLVTSIPLNSVKFTQAEAGLRSGSRSGKQRKRFILEIMFSYGGGFDLKVMEMK